MSANIPQPVPSKAAIRALRGLVLGTSCTLALVTEDRRRRINAARSAIRNGDRIRSARQYKTGGGSFVPALEEESTVASPEMVHWNMNGEAEKRRGPNSASAPTSTTSSTSRAPPAMAEPNPNHPLTQGRLVSWPSTASSRQTIARQTKLLLSESLPSSALSAALTTTVSAADVAAGCADQQLSDTASQIIPTSPATSSSRQLQTPAASLVQQAREYQSRTRIPPQPLAARRPLDLPGAIARIVGLTNADDLKHLQAAVKVLSVTVAEASSCSGVAADQLQALWNASAKLCSTCQEVGRLDLAQQVLRLAVGHGQLDEDTYFAHNPLPVVKSLADGLTTTVDSGVLSTNSNTASPGEALVERKAFIERLRGAATLFVPTLTAYSGKHTAPELVGLAQQLLECSFAVGHQRSTRSLYASVLSFPGDITEFTSWYMGKLRKTENYKLMIWSFLSRPPNAEHLSDQAFLALGDSVVEAVGLSHSSKAGEVLQTLFDMCTVDGRQLRTAWVTELLYCHWRNAKDYELPRDLFSRMTANGGVASKVYHKDGPYRAMIQIALEAGKPADAQAYFDELVSLEATASGDIRILALFALAKANEGNWQGVRDDFQKAADSAGPAGLPARDSERVFVPIVKQFIKSHTISETEDFVKSYVDDLGVPIGRHMVTLLANEYGALREVDSFIGWLEFCSKAGFVIDAAFSNAILQNCRKHWKFPFHDLRTLYRKLRLLGPNFEDRVTQHIMMNAAASDGQHGMRAVHSRVVSLHLRNNFHTKSIATDPISPFSKARFRNENDAFVAMKKAFASGNFGKVVREYRHALRSGMPLTEKTLELAVGAAIRGRKRPLSAAAKGAPLPPSQADLDTAVELLKEAHKAGLDIDAAASYVVMACVDDVRPGQSTEAGRRAVAQTVESMLSRLETQHMRVSDEALNRAAFHLLKVGHVRGAITLAMSAANTAVGGGQPGYNVWNFSVLVAAYAQIADPEGLRVAIEGAAASGVSSATLGFKVLKKARKELLRRCGVVDGDNNSGNDKKHRVTSTSTQVQKALQAVEDGLEHGRAARRQLIKDRRQLETAAVNIMQQAALDAGCEPVELTKSSVSPRRHSRSKPEKDLSTATDISGADEQKSISADWELLLSLESDDGLGKKTQPVAPSQAMVACSS